MSSWSWLASDGSRGSAAQKLCAGCFEADEAASDARQRGVHAGLADGSIFAEIRAELAEAEDAGDASALASAAEFIDLLTANLDVPVPADLRAFADRHRDPAA